MTDAKPFNAAHSAFNDLLTNSIQKGHSLLSRNHINEDYDEADRKDLNPNVSQSFSGKKSRVGQSRYGESRFRPASKSPLKEYINSKIDTHIEKLKGSSVAGRQVEVKPQQDTQKSEYDNMMFESVVESNVNPYADEQVAQDAPKKNVNFKADNDTANKHQVIKISGNYDWDQKAPKRSAVDELSKSHERHRPALSKVSIHHHDSPTRASRVIDRTHHDVHDGEQIASSSLRKSQNLAGVEAEGHPEEDHWITASRSIDRLYEKHSELEQNRMRQCPATGDELARDRDDETSQSKSYRYAVETQYGTPSKRIDETFRLRALEDMSPAHVEAHETTVTNSNSQLVNRYHAMKQHGAKIARQTLKFSATRINPPRCLLDVLDALFSLIYGVYGKVEQDYFNAKEKKYFEYKVYFQSLDELTEVLSHLKLYVETQGLPVRNVMAADKALCRYNKTVKRIEAKPYLDTTEEIAKFVLFFLEYYNVLRVIHDLN